MIAKSVPVTVSPDVQRGPGWAWMTLMGVGETSVPNTALSCSSDWSLTLQRNQDSYFLVGGGNWAAPEVWHHIHQVQQGSQGLQFLVGPELLDALLADPRMVCRVQIVGQDTAHGLAFAGVLRFERDVMPSGASGQSPGAAQQAPIPSSAPRIEAVTQSLQDEVIAVPDKVETPTSAAPSTRVGLWLVLVLLLVAALAAYGWWRLTQTPEPVTGAVTPGSTNNVGGTLPPVCSMQAMQAAADDLIFLQACVADKPDSQTVLGVIEAAKQANRCDLLQRLYAHQAQSGQLEVALAYAREFDPATFKGGCFKQPDVPTAMYWYETILQTNPGRTDIAARMKELEALK